MSSAALGGGRNRAVVVGVAAGIAVLVGMLGGLATDIGPWYRALQKPSWQPPDWLFGPVWTTIYVLVVTAAVMAWNRAPDAAYRRQLLQRFLLNAVLNVSWSVLFFTLKRPDWALVEVALLWASIVAMILVARRVSVVAGWLLVPYLAWVSFASVLTAAIVQRNAPFGAG